MVIIRSRCILFTMESSNLLISLILGINPVRFFSLSGSIIGLGLIFHAFVFDNLSL